MILKGFIKKYDWGKKGKESFIFNKLNEYQNNNNFIYINNIKNNNNNDKKQEDGIIYDKFNENDFYAEYWMGTHEQGSSIVIGNLELPKKLDSIEILEKDDIDKIDFPKLEKKMIIDNKGLFIESKELNNVLGKRLPFLFKLLTIGKALSIQAHPDEILGKKLYENFPQIYKDDKAKPEMVLAITEMELLCSFRPFEDIFIYVCHIPELRTLVGEELIKAIAHQDWNNNEKRKELVKKVFNKFIKNEGFLMQKLTFEFYNRTKNIKETILTMEEKCFLKLYSQYPNDPGCFCVFFLNRIELKPNQALYLPANEPHSYISGDCFEIMNASDNVIRCGLTNKFKDIDTLCTMLTYIDKKPLIIEPEIFNDFEISVLKFKPKIDKSPFEIEKIELKENQNHLIKFENDSILFIFNGTIFIHPCLTEHSTGTTLFLQKDQTIFINAKVSSIIYIGKSLLL